MQAVHLRQLKFFSFHGVYEEEKKTGNEFEVNVTVEFEETQTDNSFFPVVDYVQLYSIIQKEMNQPRQLLESVAESIVANVYASYTFVRSIQIEIWKLHPPIEQFQGRVGITLHKTFTGK